MAWHYYLSSLLSEDKRKREDLKSKAVKETDWLFIANIALSLSKISKKTEKIIYLIKDAISSYEKYLDEKEKKLPTFTIFIDGNLRDEQMVKSVTEKTGGYFITKVSPILKNKPVEIEELDIMIERTDFILILVDNNVNEMLSFEMGLAYTTGKPVVLFVPGDISRLNPIFSKAATVTQKLEYAITVLRLFSIIKSGEILKVEKDEKEKITDFLKSIERFEIPELKIEFKPSFIEGEMPLKQKQRRLRGDKV
jgi:nucleoside 2-deoxyribosyltransferase